MEGTAMMRDDMLKRLDELDEEASLLFDSSKRFHLIIVGGGALILMEYLTRSTHDIDVIDVSVQLQDLLTSYDINSNVKTYVDNFPYNYEDRMKKLDVGGRIIDFYTASLEDIVIAKLHSYRDTDFHDVTDPAIVSGLDWDLLHELATSEDEFAGSALSRRAREEFLISFNRYEKEYRP